VSVSIDEMSVTPEPDPAPEQQRHHGVHIDDMSVTPEPQHGVHIDDMSVTPEPHHGVHIDDVSVTPDKTPPAPVKQPDKRGASSLFTGRY
jgi:hypothetical protein